MPLLGQAGARPKYIFQASRWRPNLRLSPASVCDLRFSVLKSLPHWAPRRSRARRSGAFERVYHARPSQGVIRSGDFSGWDAGRRAQSRSMGGLSLAGVTTVPALLRDLAEISVEASSREAYRRIALAHVCRSLSIDAAAINHATLEGTIEVDSYGLSAVPLRPLLPRYLQEFSTAELRATQGRTVRDTSFLSVRRRDSLGLYRNFLGPGTVFGFCVRMWSNRHGCFWMTFSRAGRCARYSDHDLKAFDAVTSIVAVGEALHAKAVSPVHCGTTKILSRGGTSRAPEPETESPSLLCSSSLLSDLTRAETRVLHLIGKGLSNREIATHLFVSTETVRTHVHRILGKLGVRSRTAAAAMILSG